MNNTIDLEQTIFEMVQSNAVGLSDKLTRSTHLIKGGIIDSLGIVDISTAIEKKYSIKIPETDVNPANFSSIESITNIVRKLTSDKNSI